MAPHSSTLAWKIPWTEEPGIKEKVLKHLTKKINVISGRIENLSKK